MLGAQALRTKQRVEEKEKRRREKERQQKLELQRERILQNAANDEAMLEFAAHQAAMNGNVPHAKPHQRHSLHTTVINDHIISVRGNSQPDIGHGRLPAHLPPSEYTKDEGSSGGNRLFKWLGLSSSNNQKKQKRRMSTY